MSKRLLMRLAQVALVVILGISAQGATCLDCHECTGQSCGTRACDHCPASWWGSCYAGTEGCGHYGCYNVGQCCSGIGVCLTYCDCPPCVEG